jgi:hexosaminidase
MKIFILALTLFSILSFAQDTMNTVSIIPKPLSIKQSEGSFILNDSTKIFVANNPRQLKPIAEHIASRLRTVTEYPFELAKSSREKNNSIILMLDEKLKHLGNEGYQLVVAEKTITIKSFVPTGIFYGVQSLYQLLPPEVEKNERVAGVNWSITCVTIEDKPRFQWRGMHLDVCRHFFPKEFVKKYIDLLASYKMNIFHWHLTEDQGWRIEIKKYPKLTEIGSKRKETMDDSTPYGGYYTQEEIKEVVQYAQERFITIVPEIEMPGHSLAAITAYPEFSCTGGPFEVGTTWGVFDDVYCAGNEKTFKFLKDVLSEVIPLFPGKFFHIGGDECPKARWKKCPKCQARIKKNKLGNEHRLQSYFVQRIERFLRSKGKRLVGWDEILEGGLAPGATVMSWRGTEGGIAAAKANHDVVMTPGSHCYLDHYQGLPDGEPKASGGFLPIETVYAYEPVPAELKPKQTKHILGAQGNVWTEYMPNTRHAEYMVLPRLLAMSEVVWSDKKQRNFEEFSKRLEQHYDRFVFRDFNFRVPTPLGIGGTRYIFEPTNIELQSPVTSASIYYRLDGLNPTEESIKYMSPIQITDDHTLKAILVLPNGKKSPLAVTNIFLVNKNKNGLEYLYFEGEWDSLPNFKLLQPVRTGKVYNIDLDGLEHRGENFAVQFIGTINIEKENDYTFYLASDDGSKLFIDENEVVNQDGLHGPSEKSGKVKLISGKHKIEVQYFQRWGGKIVKLYYEGNNIQKQVIPPRLFIQN